MASLGHSKLHEDLQAAFLRYREGRYDADLDSKELNVILWSLTVYGIKLSQTYCVCLNL